MAKGIVEKPLEEVRNWKKDFAKKLAKMSHHEIIKNFGKTEKIKNVPVTLSNRTH